MRPRLGAFAVIALLLGCSPDLRAPAGVINARFDPTAKVIPMPSDILRDADKKVLALDVDDPSLNPATRELYRFLNTLDGWLATSGAKVEFTGAISPASLTPDTVRVYLVQGNQRRRLTIKPKLARDGKSLTFDPPEDGWPRGSTVVVAVRGGDRGVVGARGETVECDAAFYFLRLRNTLTDPKYNRAFPGDTRAERADAAKDLEEIRVKLAPHFEALEKDGLPRREVAALWTFTVSERTELMMDKASGKMPLPFDLLLDRKTGLVDVPARATDTDMERNAKVDLRIFDGFGPTMNPLFELSAPADPATINDKTVELWRISPPQRVPVKVTLAKDLRRVELVLQKPPLDPATRYAIVVRQDVRDSQGQPIVPTAIGHFVRAKHTLLDKDGKSLLSTVEDDSAQQLEWVRTRVAPLLDAIGRTGVAAAWPFTTMSVVPRLLKWRDAAKRLNISPHPKDVTSKSITQAVLDFPLGITSLLRVERVYYGTIDTAEFLDPQTRARFADGKHITTPIPFVLTIPRGAKKGQPLPVAVFGHAIVTESRFVLAVADALAARGIATISIDFPYHGKRTHCAWDGPLCLPNPLSEKGEMVCPNPCSAGKCASDGKCRDSSGAQKSYAKWPIIPFNQASGAAFIDVEHIWATRDHFFQAITDLGALTRSLRTGNWERATGYKFDTANITYLGQSLGGIIGSTYVAVDPGIKRAVLNVPGANLVPLFVESTYFGPHIDAFLKRHKIEKGSADHQRFLNLARWLVDAADPINVARYLAREPLPGQKTAPGQRVLVQMATLDFIIPNTSTKLLAEVAQTPRRDYIGEHAFLVVPVEPAFLRGTREAADFLAGSFKP